VCLCRDGLIRLMEKSSLLLSKPKRLCQIGGSEVLFTISWQFNKGIYLLGEIRQNSLIIGMAK